MRLLPAVLVACKGDGGTDAGPDDPVLTPTDPYADIVPTFPWTDEDLDGMRVTHYVPDDPAGVLFAFHGSDGNVESVQQVEWIELYNHLAAEGFAIVLTQSLDRVAEQWDTSTSDPVANADFVRVSAARDHLIATTALEATTPVFAIGFSNGGNFTLMFVNMAHELDWDVRAYASHQSSYYEPTPMPGFFVGNENDEHGLDGDAVAPLAERCTEDSARTCPAREVVEVPLHPLWFARMPYYDEAQSENIFGELVDMAIVDEEGERLIDLADMDAAFASYFAETENPNPDWVPTQLRVVWATHRFSSQHARAEADFFLDHL